MPPGAKDARTGLLFEVIPGPELEPDHPLPFTLVADCFRNTAATLRALVTPSSSIGVGHMSGPVGIMNLYYNIFKNPDWWRLVLWFSVILNVGLAIFNLLPLPVLDGGHITMAVIEMVRGRTLGTRLLEYIQLVCVLFLLSFVLFVSFKDVGGIVESEENEVFLPRQGAAAVP
jgi:regulator of sigma E protease